VDQNSSEVNQDFDPRETCLKLQLRVFLLGESIRHHSRETLAWSEEGLTRCETIGHLENLAEFVAGQR